MIAVDDDAFADQLVRVLRGPRGPGVARLIMATALLPASMLADTMPDKHRVIVEQVAFVCGVSAADILSPSRSPRPTRARAIAMSLCREITGASYPEIGKLYDRDHSTVFAACKRVESSKLLVKARARVLDALGNSDP